VGQVNGLSVSWSGDFEFGLPHQISCTVGVGHGGIIDLEREAELGGPIHTKAMLILKSYLVNQFARNKPLVLTGSLCFEQNYAGVEGDSASGAELAALLSAIAGAPLRLSLAFTGAVSQSGHILAVGSVTRKIEGFFELCSRRGLTGSQVVIIPHDNVDHLMLSPRIVEAVARNRFSIIPVRHITESLELLTGLPAGRPLKKGGFTPGSLYDMVDRRLFELGRMAEPADSRPARGRKRTR
jgi:predicted ATP-dependent protease